MQKIKVGWISEDPLMNIFMDLTIFLIRQNELPKEMKYYVLVRSALIIIDMS